MEARERERERESRSEQRRKGENPKKMNSEEKQENGETKHRGWKAMPYVIGTTFISSSRHFSLSSTLFLSSSRKRDVREAGHNGHRHQPPRLLENRLPHEQRESSHHNKHLERHHQHRHHSWRLPLRLSLRPLRRHRLLLHYLLSSKHQKTLYDKNFLPLLKWVFPRG